MKPKITLIAPRSPFLLNEKPYPPLGILYLSAFLKMHGVDVQCLDMGYGHLPEMAEADIIGLSVTTPQWAEALKLLSWPNQKKTLKIVNDWLNNEIQRKNP